MKTHATLGRDAIDHAERSLGAGVDFLRLAKEIALSHQEKWDGSGYPQGLSGDAFLLIHPTFREIAKRYADVEKTDRALG